MLLYDIWWLRYKKPGDKWYELLDYLRDSLARDGYLIRYNDKEQDIICDEYDLDKKRLAKIAADNPEGFRKNMQGWNYPGHRVLNSIEDLFQKGGE